MEHWDGWNEQLVTYFENRKSCQLNISLSYVIRKESVPDDTSSYSNIESMEVANAPHVVIVYEKDCREVYAVIKLATIGGQGWTYVEPFDRISNGRGAYWALLSHYEGEAQMSTKVDKENDSVQQTIYHGKSRSFNFEKFANVLKRAYIVLEKNGEVVSDQTKVRWLVMNIRDASLESACKVVLASDTHKSNFDREVDYLEGICEGNTSLQKSRNRNISSAAGTQGHQGCGGHSSHGSGWGGHFNGRVRGRSGGRGTPGG